MSPARHPGGESYRVELVAMPGDVPPIIRLRQALKRFLRGYRLRCTAVSEAPKPTAGEPTAGPSPRPDPPCSGPCRP
jgi:hypothetical protein